MVDSILMPANEYVRQLQFAEWQRGGEVPWIDEMWKRIDAHEQTFDYREYKVHHAPVSFGDWQMEVTEIGKRDYERLYHVLNGPQINLDRDTGWGRTTILKKDRKVWMSDTRAEIVEHLPWINKCWWINSLEPRVLINGLGIGLAVQVALNNNASHVDVVEIDPDVIEVVGKTWANDSRVEIHQGDAFTYQFPRGTAWHVAWHDIWPTISEDNVPEMDRLHSRYKKRVGWQGSWQRKGCLEQRRRTKQFQEALENQDWARVKQLDPEF